MVAAAKAAGPYGFDLPRGPETTQGAIQSLPRGRRHPIPTALSPRRPSSLCKPTRLYAVPQHVGFGRPVLGRGNRQSRPLKRADMHDPADGFRSICLPRTPLNRGRKEGPGCCSSGPYPYLRPRYRGASLWMSVSLQAVVTARGSNEASLEHPERSIEWQVDDGCSTASLIPFFGQEALLDGALEIGVATRGEDSLALSV